MSNSPRLFSESFYDKVPSSKKDQLIETIASKIYSKHKDLISLAKVRDFTTHTLKSKQNIGIQDLQLIESKI